MVSVYVIIPNYNAADYLARCLDSLRAQQGGPPLEVYVVDNASGDDSVTRVQEGYPEVHLLTSERNGGFAWAVNRALRLILDGRPTSPYYVLLLNPDTELPSDALRKMVEFMEAHPEAGAAGPKLVLGDGRMDLACRRSFPTADVAFCRLFGLSRLFPRSRLFGRYNLTYLDPNQTTEVDAISGAFMLVRGQVVEEVGLLDEAFFLYGEDLDWAYRIKARGWKVYYYPSVEVRHWKRASSRTRARESLRDFYRAMRTFHRKHLASRYPRPVNSLIELGISLREGLALLSFALAQRRKGR